MNCCDEDRKIVLGKLFYLTMQSKRFPKNPFSGSGFQSFYIFMSDSAPLNLSQRCCLVIGWSGERAGFRCLGLDVKQAAQMLFSHLPKFMKWLLLDFSDIIRNPEGLSPTRT